MDTSLVCLLFNYEKNLVIADHITVHHPKPKTTTLFYFKENSRSLNRLELILDQTEM